MPKKASEPTPEAKSFFFSEFGFSVEAKSLEEAEAKAKKKLAGQVAQENGDGE